MTSLSAYILPLVLLAIIHSVVPAEKGRPMPAAASRHSQLALLLKKRASGAALRGPPISSIFPDSIMESPDKRAEEEYWIWMPAHGYVPIPKNEDPETREYDSMGNLLRYG